MDKTNNKKQLVIVESPAKARTINKYLGPKFEVKACKGHIRDLPAKGLNVDIDNDFKPTYEIMPGKERTVGTLKTAAKKCDRLYLATDLDREGEAIAWHLAQILNIPSENIYRVIFNAITKSAIQKAFSRPGKLDMDKVLAQQARRILDRIVGYQISPLLWRKVAAGLSAGRVQSVTVKMIVERERQIRAFKPKEYWLIPAIFSTILEKDYQQNWQDFLKKHGKGDKEPTVKEQNDWLAQHNAFKAQLEKINNKKFEVSDEQQAREIYEAVKNSDFKVAKIEQKQTTSRPQGPFITSTLQQAAANRLGFSTKRTMRIAQQLYEGIDLGTMGRLGLITYMRTDSTHISPEALREVRDHIKRNIGDEYLPEKANYFSSKKGAQQAHEAIRPTDIDLTPMEIKSLVTDEQFKLYDLIWRRFVASQMSAAKWDITNVDISSDTSVGNCSYRATGRVVVFDGFTKIWPTFSEQQHLPRLQTGQKLSIVDTRAEQHFTKPPARFTEASLVRALEKEGIGRPSTYAPIISTIQERGYAEQTDKKFYATDVGEVVTDKLNEYFPKIMDVSFTSYMEQQLDEIEEQQLDWIGVLKEFYGPFKESLEKASSEMKHAKAETKPSEYRCPLCGKELVYKFGKKGRFLSCSAYPECKFASPIDKEGKMVEQKGSSHSCPVCGKQMVYRQGRYGPFLGCSDYPNCKTVLKLDKAGNVIDSQSRAEPTGIKCYKCNNGELVVRQSKRGPFLGCNNFPRCRTIVGIKKMDLLKQLQNEGKWPPKSIEQAKQILASKKTKK